MSRAQQIVNALLEGEQERSAHLVAYYPRRGDDCEYALFVDGGAHTSAKRAVGLRKGLEQLAGRPLAWSRGQISIEEPVRSENLDSILSSRKFDVVTLRSDGSVSVELKSESKQ